VTIGTEEAPIIIAGGGIGGLAAALGLARNGFRSLILEKAAALGEIGAASSSDRTLSIASTISASVRPRAAWPSISTSCGSWMR
jgi:2-polyprenyl-6-methoxyphenol hydroxylase-like FAD-dependent oxidoreductase